MKRKILIIPMVLFLLITTHLITYKTDQYRISKNKNPLFSVPTVYIKDGGTTIYFGFGYQVIYWHFLSTETIDKKEIKGHETGYEIHNLFDLKYIPFITYDFKPDNNTELIFIAE